MKPFYVPLSSYSFPPLAQDHYRKPLLFMPANNTGNCCIYVYILIGRPIGGESRVNQDINNKDTSCDRDIVVPIVQVAPHILILTLV